MAEYIEASGEAARSFYEQYAKDEKIVMLNLLKFHKIANYIGLEPIKPEDEITGKEAYSIYMKNVFSLLKEYGSKLLFFGECSQYLIGPQKESWDMIIMVEHLSKESFLKFTNSETYAEIKGHRTAALKDSRLLPITGAMTR